MYCALKMLSSLKIPFHNISPFFSLVLVAGTSSNATKELVYQHTTWQRVCAMSNWHRSRRIHIPKGQGEEQYLQDCDDDNNVSSRWRDEASSRASGGADTNSSTDPRDGLAFCSTYTPPVAQTRIS